MLLTTDGILQLELSACFSLFVIHKVMLHFTMHLNSMKFTSYPF